MSLDYARLNMTKRQAVFRLLSDAAWHGHQEIAKVGGVRYSARLLELKRLGFLVETQDTGTQGRMYRLVSIVPGRPQPKRVKVFLEEEDVRAMVRGIVPSRAQAALADAHGSYVANREKL